MPCWPGRRVRRAFSAIDKYGEKVMNSSNYPKLSSSFLSLVSCFLTVWLAAGPAAYGQCVSSFTAAVNYGVTDPSSAAIGDLNGDGRPDLAVADYNSNNVSVLLGNGNGTFQAAVNYPAGTYPSSVAIGDLNGDGKPDLVVANEVTNNVSVL